MDRMQEILSRTGLATTFEKMSPRDYEQFKIDGLNNTVGNRNEEDGYDCPICKNKGYVVKLVENEGSFSQAATDCKCIPIRNSIMRMKRSGLKDIIKDYTFDKFIDSEPWQKSIKKAAVEYSENPNGWFGVFGQSGAGKTHICTAICRKFLLEGKRVIYMLWRDEIVKLKAMVNESDEYRDLIDKYKTAEVLYIDDLFKTGKDKDNMVQRPTAADVNVAFEIINYRYNNPGLITIISSECTEDELLDIDEAVGGRIYERSTAFSIAKNRSRNYRMRKAVTL